MLRHVQWLDTGSATAYDQWRHGGAALPGGARPSTSRATQGDVDLPAYNFTAADLGSERADRDPAMAWSARALLVAVLLVRVARLRAAGSACSARCRGAAALRALFVAATRPWRLAGGAGADRADGPGGRVGAAGAGARG